MKLLLNGFFSRDTLNEAGHIENRFREAIAKHRGELDHVQLPLAELAVSVIIVNPQIGSFPDSVKYFRARASVEIGVSIGFTEWLSADTPGKVALFGAALQRGIALGVPKYLAEDVADRVRDLIVKVCLQLGGDATALDQATATNGCLGGKERESVNEVGVLQHVRLYKHADAPTYYYEVWATDNAVMEHWGRLGDRGDVRKHEIASVPEQGELLAKLVQLSIDAGFVVADDDSLKDVRVRLPCRNGRARRELAETRHRLEDMLDQELGWKGLGFCDGGETGDGSIELRCLVIDAEVGRKAILEALSESGFQSAVIIAK